MSSFQRRVALRPLPELLARGLSVVFCGTAAGRASAKRRAYYAGPGNAFWPTLFRTRLIPTPHEPERFREVLARGIGFTDLVRRRVGVDAELRPRDFDRKRLRRTIERFQPGILAFNGKRAAEEFYERKVEYGRQRESIGATSVYVLPSTSAAARAAWDPAHWARLARAVRHATPARDPSPRAPRSRRRPGS